MWLRLAPIAVVVGCYIEPDPPRFANIAFVTSQTMAATSIAGLAGGDAICNTSAAAAGLPGHYVAWLSTTAVDAPTRLGTASGWVRPDGKPFANHVNDLVAGHIYYPLRIDERGEDVVIVSDTDQVPVATGTKASGMDDLDCTDFTGIESSILVSGVPDGTTDAWTERHNTSCTDAVRLYCFGTDLVGEVAPPAEVGRRAFLSTQAFKGTTGIAAADQLCGTEAAAAGLTGSFAALLGVVGQHVATRFPLTTPWVRPDGVIVSTDLTSFTAPLNVTLAGKYVDDNVWSGSFFDMTTSTGDNCNDWTDPATTGVIGAASRSDSRSIDDSTGADCNDSHAIYCLEK